MTLSSPGELLTGSLLVPQGHSGCVNSLNLLLVIEWAAADVPAAEQSWEGVEEVGGGLKLPVSPMCSWLPKQRLDEWTVA